MLKFIFKIIKIIFFGILAICLIISILLLWGVYFPNTNQHFGEVKSPLNPEKKYTQVTDYQVVWDSPSENEHASMPLGNGDIGLNVWVEKSGDLVFYMAKTDAWDEYGRLLKLGKMRVKILPQPFQNGNFLRQTLNLSTGTLEIELGNPQKPLKLQVWADAHQPLIHVEAKSETKIQIQTQFETWRTQARPLAHQISTWQKLQLAWGYLKLVTAIRIAPQNVGALLFELLTILVTEKHSAFDLQNAPEAVQSLPDKILQSPDNQIVWLHHNQTSVWESVLKLQSLNPQNFQDPLKNRVFGGLAQGENFQKIDAQTLQSSPQTHHHLQVYLQTLPNSQEKQWLDSLQNKVSQAQKIPLDSLRQKHQQWWQEFWQHSYIFVNGDEKAHLITQGAILQRFISACAGRGVFPIKFNGSLFTVGAEFGGKKYDADFRRWGGAYWWQNTRLIYYPMLAQGDWAMMLPLFDMYREALPVARARTQAYFGHSGVFFPETMNFWGTFGADDYGWDRKGKKIGEIQNSYLKHYYSTSLEISYLALEYGAYTQDSTFVVKTALPIAEAVLDFYDQHFKRKNGKLFISPAQSLETWAIADNPSPDIAGLRLILNNLQAWEKYLSPTQTQKFNRLLNELPALPTQTENGKTVILPAEKFEKRQNIENPETYTIFPFKQFSLQKADVAIARQTFENRHFKGSQGWQYDDVQAATLGLTAEAKARLIARASQKDQKSRFPAFWGPNFDWTPDQCHGGNLQLTLQKMLLQTEGKQILLFPAWDKAWDVDFKLYASENTLIEARLQGGKLVQLKVSPESRRKDVKVLIIN
jgi:alpha-L-fucosidase 2